MAALRLVPKNPDRVSHYKEYLNELCIDNITFPVIVTQIADFEKMNQSISVNVYALEGDDIFPLYVSPHADREHDIDLLLLQEEEQEAHHQVGLGETRAA